MKLKRIAIEDLTPDPDNVRLHPRHNVEAVVESLRRFGQQKPIVVDEKGVVVAGNATLEAAIELGWDGLICLVTALEGAERVAYAIADNRVAEGSDWKYAELADALVAMDGDLVRKMRFAVGESTLAADVQTEAERLEEEGSDPDIRATVSITVTAYEEGEVDAVRSAVEGVVERFGDLCELD